MTDAEPPPAVEVEEAMPTTPDIALDSEGCQDVEAIKGEEDGGAPYGEVGKLGESLKPHGDGVVADEHMGIAEDPNLPDAKSDEPEDADAKSDEPEDAGAEVQADDVASAVDVLKEGVGVAVASSTLVDAPTEVGMQTNEATAVDDFTEVGAALVTSTSMDDPTEMGSSLVIDDCNIVSTGGVHRPDEQPDKVAGADSLDADMAAPLVNDVQDDSASTDKDVAASDDVAQGHETPLMDVSTALLNEVDTESVKARDHVAEDTNMDTQVQTGNDNEAEGVSTIAATTRDNSEKHNGAVGIDAFGQGIETERDGLTGDGEQKEIASADEDHVEEEGVQMDALNITGDMDKEGRIVVDNIADEAVDGMAVPEEKSAQMDEAGDDTPEEEDAQMGGLGLTGNDNEQEEAVVADHDGLEENAMLIDAAATTNDDDEDDGIVGEDVAEAATGTVGDDAPEEDAAPMDSDDDDDEPPPLVARKGGRHRKRGRPSSKAQAAVKVSIKKKDEEEVCFICFDGGDLVICDRRGCPKAYHPSCVNRDDDFFKSKGRWNCVEEISAAKSQKSHELPDTNDEEAISESSSGRHLENNTPKKRGRKRLKEAAIEDGSEGKESTRKSTKPGLSSIRDAQTSPGKKVSPSADENHGGVVDPDPSQDADGNSEASVVMSSEKRRKSRKYDQKRQPNLDDYAAIDNHNIGLMYLRRNLMEELIGDVETFDEKVVGSFVRIRIPGTGKAAEKYKSGKKTTDITLEILNLDKREAVTIDIISNQEFTEEECKRLRQSIKYGFIPRLTVGEVQEKARVLQTLKVNDWIESEKMRLGHLRDRAIFTLRECVEKLKLLSTPEERARRLNEEPEIHADPAMDPDYESPEEQEQETERNSFNKSRGSFLRKDVLLSLNVSQTNSIVVVSPADTRHQMSTPSAAPVQPVVTAIAGSDTQSSGWAISAQGANTSVQSQVAGNMTWGPAPQGDASMGWGMMGQSNMNMPWVASAQGASGYNMGVTMPTQPSAVPSVGWVPNPGNTSMNMIWAATQGQGTPNAAAMMGGQMQGVAMANWGGVAAGNANTYPGWGTQQIGNMNQNVSWSAPVQGTPGQANNNMNWNASNGNPDWNNQQRDNGGRHSGHRDSGGRWKSRSGGDGGSRGHRPPGVCWSYVNSGHCWKVDCRYTHPPNTDGYSSRNDRQFDRQHSGNERRFDNHNERNDRQFDRQPPDSERPDDRHNSRDDDRHDDQQADRSQSRERR
nr:unnamed protein product [Digitaria exilis]